MFITKKHLTRRTVLRGAGVGLALPLLDAMVPAHTALSRTAAAAKPRIVRDALIQALTRPEKDTLWHQDKSGAKITVKDLGVRGHTRKIALLDKYTDKNMHDIVAYLCTNCHDMADGRLGATVMDKKDRELLLYEGIYRTFLWLLETKQLALTGKNPHLI